MRDHPHHQAAVMGGMGGCRGGSFDGLEAKLNDFEFSGSYGEDQEFLEECVWNEYRAEALVHDSHGSYDGEIRSFPGRRNERQFMGERVNQDGSPRSEDHDLLVDCKD